MSKYFIFTGAYLFLINIASAQIEPIDADRPDQTESPVTLPKKFIQLGTGFSFQKGNEEEKEFLIPTLLTKYGLTNRIELGLITGIKTESSVIIPIGTIRNTGLDVVEAGVKISLFEEKNMVPKTSILIHAGLPAFSYAKFKPDKLAPNFKFSMAHTLSPKTSLGYNLGCEWDGLSNDPAYIYTLTLGHDLEKKIYGYVEIFGAFKKLLIPEHNVDTGLAYLISNNCKADISTGFGLTGSAFRWYVAVGASVRFTRTK